MIRFLSVFAAVTVFPAISFAQEAAEAAAPDADNVGEIVQALIAAFRAGDWNIVAATVLMLAVWILLKSPVGNAIGPKAKPWIAASMGVVGAVVANFFSGGDWLSAVLSGLTVGAAASGLWSLVGKSLFGSSDAEDSEE